MCIRDRLTFVPKLIGVFLALILFGGISGGLIADFALELYTAIPQMAR